MGNVIKTFKSLLENIYIILSIFTGFVITLYIIYIRLILVRLPRDLYVDISLVTFGIYLWILSIFVILFIYTIYKIFFYKEKPNRIDYLRYIRPILTFWNNSLESLDNYIKSLFENQWDFTVAVGLYCYRKFFKKVVIELAIIFFCILPKLIVVFAFLIDVLLYQRFNYFYKASILLIIPLIFNYIMYSIFYLAETNIIQLGEDIQLVDSQGNILLPIYVTMDLIRGKKDFNHDFELTQLYLSKYPEDSQDISFYNLKRLVKIYADLHKIYDFGFDVKYRKEYMLRYINIIMYGLYSIGWGYIIWFGLSLDLKVVLMIIIINIIDKEEPFSGLNI